MQIRNHERERTETYQSCVTFQLWLAPHYTQSWEGRLGEYCGTQPSLIHFKHLWWWWSVESVSKVICMFRKAHWKMLHFDSQMLPQWCLWNRYGPIDDGPFSPSEGRLWSRLSTPLSSRWSVVRCPQLCVHMYWILEHLWTLQAFRRNKTQSVSFVIAINSSMARTVDPQESQDRC